MAHTGLSSYHGPTLLCCWHSHVVVPLGQSPSGDVNRQNYRKVGFEAMWVLKLVWVGVSFSVPAFYSEFLARDRTLYDGRRQTYNISGGDANPECALVIDLNFFCDTCAVRNGVIY